MISKRTAICRICGQIVPVKDGRLKRHFALTHVYDSSRRCPDRQYCEGTGKKVHQK